MQSTGIGRGTAEKPWQELPGFLWLIVGVKQMKRGPQSLVIGIPQGDIWVWKFLHVWFAHIRGGSSCWHWEKLWKYLVSRSLFISHGSWVSFDFALNVYILSMRDHMEGTTLALWQRREGRNKIYLRHWAMVKMEIELKQSSRVLKHICGVRIESCRFSSVAQKIGNNPSKKILIITTSWHSSSWEPLSSSDCQGPIPCPGFCWFSKAPPSGPYFWCFWSF